MNDPRPVGCVQSFRDLFHHLNDKLERQRFSGELGPERNAVRNILHDQVGAPPELSRVIDGEDMGMIELS